MNTKHLFKTLLVGVAVSMLMPLTVNAQSITIDETNFPDANFRNYLSGQEYGSDGILTEDEINGIVMLSVSNKNISDLKGIEYFTAVQYLWCSDNQLATLDVSKNTALTYLQCNGNQLTALDVSGCVELKMLHCYDNQLTTLDLSKNVALGGLFCYNNQLNTLDLHNNAELTGLQCQDNNLTALDVSMCTVLGGLACSNNELTTLDVSKNTLLASLSCDNNNLMTLDVSSNGELTSIACSSNQIKGEAMDALISSLPQNTSTGSSNRITIFDATDAGEGNVCTKKQVAAIKDKGWIPYCYYEAPWGLTLAEYEGSDEESAGIDTMHVGKDGKNTIYTLDGKQLPTTNAAELPKGIYIINGKKMVVK